MDNLDHKILARLRENGRAAFRELADELGVAEGTVRNRMNRLIEQDVMRLVAVTNPLALGYRLDCFIGLEVDFLKIESIVTQLANYEEIRYVGIAIGPYDVIVAGSFVSEDDLLEFLTKKLAKLEGVKRSETSHMLRTLKRTYDWTPPDKRYASAEDRPRRERG